MVSFCLLPPADSTTLSAGGRMDMENGWMKLNQRKQIVILICRKLEQLKTLM